MDIEIQLFNADFARSIISLQQALHGSGFRLNNIALVEIIHVRGDIQSQITDEEKVPVCRQLEKNCKSAIQRYFWSNITRIMEC